MEGYGPPTPSCPFQNSSIDKPKQLSSLTRNMNTCAPLVPSCSTVRLLWEVRSMASAREAVPILHPPALGGVRPPIPPSKKQQRAQPIPYSQTHMQHQQLRPSCTFMRPLYRSLWSIPGTSMIISFAPTPPACCLGADHFRPPNPVNLCSSASQGELQFPHPPSQGYLGSVAFGGAVNGSAPQMIDNT